MTKLRSALLAAAGLALGAPIAITHASDAPQAARPKVEALTMMSVAVPSSDLDRSVDFYTKGLGLTVAGRNEVASASEVMLAFPGGGSGLMLLKPKVAGAALTPRGTPNRVILTTPDMAALAARLTSAGYKLAGPIRDLPQYKVKVGFVSDPDGNNIELVELGS
jgi:catechol 2,3-dioxygenase-like lactoylglutathione lyase family enzyme